MKSVDVKPTTYTEFGLGNNDKDPKFKVGHHIKISKYQNTFAKGYVLNWCEEVFIKKSKNTVTWTYVIGNLNGVEVVGTSYKRIAKNISERVY